MRLGMLMPYLDGLVTSGGFLREFAAAAEDCGLESLWTVEHVVVAQDYEPLYPYSPDGKMPGGDLGVPMTDPLETLAFLAGASTTLKLGTAMVVAPLHSPVVLAKRAATLDIQSGGRLLLGLGIGWQKEEYAAIGVPFADRGARLDECIGAMRALWTESPAGYSGTHVSFDKQFCLPQPSRPVPIVLGGNSVPAVRRAGLVGDGWFPYTITSDDFARGADRIREIATAEGRSEDAVEMTIWPGSRDFTREFDADFVRPYVRAGASRIVLTPPMFGEESLLTGVERLADYVDRYRDEVVAKL
ncbi:LLM class F420-dependent oxidoreductase [Nocardia amikacinitolerans]|uniref:LLM class F420-dependent oxidoreductase n=1 Tax=Nocardia amikacinitolerans TaxID=756689 RepID=UPI0020A399AD|nr:LLM class F420-dependent oxidoreductase [Nocardia amikacinitolerans]MCP2279129.1 putative F420-dependent oxidoreductase, Rv2161c family [Nocardia amikacinitolerans]